MANLNKVILIGRLTAEPELRTFANGGRVAKIRFAVNNSRKNSQTGQWEDEPMFIDCDAFNRGEFGKLADRVERSCHKGTQICIEGRLHLEQWDDKTTGQKRSKHKIVIDQLHLLDRREDGPGGDEGTSRPAARSAGAPSRAGAPAPSANDGYHDDMDGHGSPAGDDVPF